MFATLVISILIADW